MTAPNITPLPTPPSRSQSPDTFSTDADTFLGALPDFATEANAQASYLDDLAVDVTAETGADAAAAAASAAAALVSENNAEAAAAAAAATADAELWVSGTTYAIGDNVFSPINFQTYRRITNGAGTTDPSLDDTNWTLLTFYAATPFTVVGNATAGAELRLPEDTDNGNHYVALKAPNAIPANLTFTLPATDGTSGQTIVTDGSGNFSFATPGSTNFQEFTTSGTWTKPVGAQFVMVEAWGAGGGGASGRVGANNGTTYNGGGTGGGGGAYVSQVFKASDLPSTVSVTIAAGGVGGAAITTSDTNGLNGTSGGNSTFGTLITARGGANGVFTTSTGGTGTGALGGQGGHSIPGSIRPGFSTTTSDIYWPASFGPMVYRSGERFNTDVPSAGYAGGSGGGVGSVRDAFAGGGSLMGGAGGGAGGGSTINAVAKLSKSGGGSIDENGGGGFAGLAFGTAGGAGAARQGGGGGGTGFGVPVGSLGDTAIFSDVTNKFYTMSGSSGALYLNQLSNVGVPDLTAGIVIPSNVIGTPTCLRLFNSVYFVCTSSGMWSSDDLATWTLRYSGNVKFIAFGGGRYVICGTDFFAWSTDYITWNNVTAYTDAFLRVRYDGTRFVAHSNNNVWISTDGATWTSNAKPSTSKYLTDVISNGTRIVTKGFDNTGGIAYGFFFYSDDFGANWVNAGATGDRETYIGTFAEYFNGNFWFSSYSTVTRAAFSANGASWTQISLGQGTVGTNFNSIAFNPSNTACVVGCSTLGVSYKATTPDAGVAFTVGGTTYSATVGGIGGAGGLPAGGGGGGGATLNGSNSGAGGAGAAGLVRVYSW